MRTGSKRGFTLIELLVVVAIIAILAAILFPIFLSSKAAARRSECMSNVGQLSKAMLIYSSDYQGRIPHWWSNSSNSSWDTAISKFVRNKTMFACPINVLNPSTHKRWVDANGKPALVRSYAMPQNVSGQLVEQAPKVSATVLLLEKGSQLIGAQADATAEWFDQTYGYNRESAGKFWHGEGKNFAFCDGHAAYFKFGRGPFGYEYPNFTGWSGADFPVNPGGKGYCGDAANAGAGYHYPPRPGANLPR